MTNKPINSTEFSKFEGEFSNFGGTIVMEKRRRYTLNEDQYKEWEQFVLNSYEDIYTNKDTHEVLHTPNSPRYVVSVLRTEQSGMQNFLENLLAI